MSSPQPWIAWLLAGWWSVGVAVAQQDSSGGASGTGASSSFGTPVPSAPAGGGGTPGASIPAPSTPATPGTGSPGTGTTGSGSMFGSGGANTGAASSFGAGTSPRQPEAAPTTFSVSTGYGSAPQSFVAGMGRLARPRFETKFSTSIGFDDNIFQTPTDGQDIPEQRTEIVVEPAVPDQIVLVPKKEQPRPQRIGIIRPLPREPVLVPTVIPGSPEVTEEIVVPGVPAPKRQSSAINRGTFTFETQLATRRSLFTFDLVANADYYWNRPNDKVDYNGSLALIYLQRLTPRLQFTASVSAAYLSQPDLSLINTPTRSGQGDYLNVTSKFDLTYRWTPRISTVSSLSYNTLTFQEKTQQSGDYQQVVFGTELRYLWSPRLTAVLEGRYGEFSYEFNQALNSNSIYALLGLDITVTRRATGTIRVGAASQTFEQDGKRNIAPYVETTLLYQLGRASVLTWNGRFGFEQPGDPNSEVLSLRTGVSVTHFFSPRLRGSLSLNGIQRVTTNDLVDTSQTELTFDGTVSMEYTLSKHWSFNGYYTYTNVIDDPGPGSYFRNRIFAGFEYEF